MSPKFERLVYIYIYIYKLLGQLVCLWYAMSFHETSIPWHGWYNMSQTDQFIKERGENVTNKVNS